MTDSFKTGRPPRASVAGMESRHISVHIERPLSEVYDYVSDTARMGEWAAGVDGTSKVTFAPRNPYGVLDHDVELASGETIHVPMRVTADGTGCEVVLTIRPQPGMSEEDMDRDAEAVRADLTALKKVMERG